MKPAACDHLRQSGLSYVEAIIAVLILSIALIPALQSVQSGIQSSRVKEEMTDLQFHLRSKMEQVRFLPFGVLTKAADSAGNYTAPSYLSDPSGQPDRRLVYLSFYDADDSDSDGDPFTIADPDSDGDSNPYTNIDPDPDISLLWIKVEIESNPYSLQTLVRQ